MDDTISINQAVKLIDIDFGTLLNKVLKGTGPQMISKSLMTREALFAWADANKYRKRDAAPVVARPAPVTSLFEDDDDLKPVIQVIHKPEPESYGEYTVHPVAALFRLIEGEEFNKLVADIKANGLREPIVLTHDGTQIVDGRNRYRACIAAGVEPKYIRLEASVSVIDFIISKNLRRRHLDTGERAALGLQMLPHLEAEAKVRQLSGLKRGKEPVMLNSAGRDNSNKNSRSVDQAAKLVGTSADSISKIKKIAETRPDLYEQVRSGEAKLNSAYQETKGKPAKPRQSPGARYAEKIGYESQIRSLEHSLQSAQVAATIKQTGLSQADAKLLEDARILYKAMGSSGWAEAVREAKLALKKGNQDD